MARIQEDSATHALWQRPGPFFTRSAARRRIGASILALVFTLTVAMPVGAISQIFGLREAGDIYVGDEAIVSAPDPYMAPGEDWSATPVSITTYTDASTVNFVEGGNIKIKDRNGNWQHWPYFAYRTAAGVYSFNSWPYYDLTPGMYYKYQVFPSGARNYFKMQFCYGNAFQYCQILLDSNMGRDSYDHAGGGGEGSCGSPLSEPQDCAIGWIGYHENHFLRGGAGYTGEWLAYCYTNVYNNVWQQGGSISACGPYPAPNWDINFK